MIACTSEAELLSNGSAASSQMERTTAELCQARDKSSTKSKGLAKVAQLKSSIISVGVNVTF